MERKINRYLRRLPRDLNSLALYSTTNVSQLSSSSIKEEFMVTKTRELILYKTFKDPKVSLANTELRTWRK